MFIRGYLSSGEFLLLFQNRCVHHYTFRHSVLVNFSQVLFDVIELISEKILAPPHKLRRSLLLWTQHNCFIRLLHTPSSKKALFQSAKLRNIAWNWNIKGASLYIYHTPFLTITHMLTYFNMLPFGRISSKCWLPNVCYFCSLLGRQKLQ